MLNALAWVAPVANRAPNPLGGVNAMLYQLNYTGQQVEALYFKIIILSLLAYYLTSLSVATIQAHSNIAICKYES